MGLVKLYHIKLYPICLCIFAFPLSFILDLFLVGLIFGYMNYNWIQGKHTHVLLSIPYSIEAITKCCF